MKEKQIVLVNVLIELTLSIGCIPKTQAMNDLKKQLSITDSINFSSFVLILGGPKLFGITILSLYLQEFHKIINI